MASTSRSKKRKAGDSVDAPDPSRIIPSELPGLKPDLYSVFFREYLDSADKASSLASGSFQYERAIQIDDNGTRRLICASKVQSRSSQILKLKSNQYEEETVFEKLLYAFYFKPYTVDSVDELLKLTEMADYYGSLQILSVTLCGALHETPIIGNEVLFNDACIFVAGYYHSPSFQSLEDPQLREVAEHMHLRISKNIVDVQEALLLITGNTDLDEESKKLNETIANTSRIIYAKDTRTTCLPEYYRMLYDELSNEYKGLIDEEHWMRPLLNSLKALLKNNLRLDASGSAGYHELSDHFLCVSIDASDLPWW
ncbi:hypothetical protein B7494_g4183 [Chlorociboria aeruginascens]|nr:hypothetical protein B7494_g4183 [Chlorociboria aeruginascens]